jgi:Family of unknown function (DUF5906)
MSALDSLADAERWVAWRNEPRGDKLTKVPYGPAGGMAKADDPATWGDRAVAEARARRLINGHGGGIGIQLGDLGADTYLGGIDLDSCLVDGATSAPWAQAICDLAKTYGEISPSSQGLKLFFYVAAEDVRPFLDRIGVDPHQWGCRRSVPGEDGRDHGPAIEVYLSGRYFTVTDRQWPGCPDRLALLDTDMLERLAGLVPPPRQSSGTGPAGDNSRSGIALRKGAALRRAGKTFEEMVEALRTDPETADWVREKGDVAGGRELRRIWEKAAASPITAATGVSLDDFYAYMPQHNYIYTPSREPWPASSINARIPPIPLFDNRGRPVLKDNGKQKTVPASTWLDRNKPVEQMTWSPGLPMIIENRLISQGGWIKRDNVSCFNLYRPPIIELGAATRAGPWLDHVRKVFPDDAEHIERWLAHRVQYPHDKINHALVLGGGMGIGKDTLLEPVKHAIGPWNFSEVSPQQTMGRFTGFLRSVILRISEARDLGDVNRYQFYEHLKVFTAAPPDVLRVDEKNLREYSIPNLCGVIITTNYKTDGIYLPADDRRHFVAWSDRKKEDFTERYWNELYCWYDNGGFENVAAYLADLDLSAFNAKAPPPRTLAFWEIVDASRAPEDAELADVIDEMGRPKIVTLNQLASRASAHFADWLRDRKNSRSVPHRLETSGYVAVRNERAKDGLWKVGGKRQVIYGDASLPLRDRIEAARDKAKPAST